MKRRPQDVTSACLGYQVVQFCGLQLSIGCGYTSVIALMKRRGLNSNIMHTKNHPQNSEISQAVVDGRPRPSTSPHQPKGGSCEKIPQEKQESQGIRRNPDRNKNRVLEINIPETGKCNLADEVISWLKLEGLFWGCLFG